MDFDLFDDDDDTAVKITRAGTKFKPKAKPKPKPKSKPVIPVKGIVAPLIPCSQQVPTTEQSEKPSNHDDQRNFEPKHGAATSTVESVVYSCPDKDVIIHVSMIPVKGIAAPLIPCSQQVPTNEPSHESEKPSNHVNAVSEHGAATSTVESVVYSCPDKDVIIPVSKENSPPCFVESPEENLDILSGLNSLGDFDLFDDDDAAVKITRAGTKFKPKAKPKPKPKPVIPVKGIAAPLIPCSQQVPTTEPSHESEKPDDRKNSDPVNAASDSEHGAATSTVEPDVIIPVSKENSPPCFVDSPVDSPGENLDILIGLDSLGDFTHDLEPVLDDTVASSEVTESHVSGTDDLREGFDDPLFHSGDDSGCLLHIPSTAPAAEDPLTGVEFDENLIPSSCGAFVDQDSGLAPTQDIIPDFPSVGPSSTTPAESIADVIAGDSDRQMNDMATPQSDAEIPGEHTRSGPKVPKKLASRRPKTKGNSAAPDHSPNDQGTCTTNQTGVARKSQRKRKNCDTSFQLVDEPEEEATVDKGLPTESASNSAACEGDEPQTKKGKRKSNKPPGEKEKKVRKKKDNEKPVAVKAAPKKFSHSTKRRKVDQSLLENQDNIDVQKVPIRDLILLAEHKERMAKKEATASQAPLPNQSTTPHAAHDNEDGGDTAFQDHNEDADYAFEHDFIDKESIPMVEESSGFFNYHTFRSTTRGPRWTKQDTELFYEAVQQFGTDFSMIQQLFPGRTRRQIKLKYKKEELQHPLRLREAVINRSESHSHFETVIERLRQMAAEEKKKRNEENKNDDSYDLEQDEEASGAKDHGEEEEEEVTATVDKEKEVEMEPDLVKEDEIPAKSDESEEDDMFSWSEYKSEL